MQNRLILFDCRSSTVFKSLAAGLSIMVLTFAPQRSDAEETPELDRLQTQLERAEAASDRFAQIELIRRILDVEPDQAELRERMVTLWLSAGAYEQAGLEMEAWEDAPEPFRSMARSEIAWNTDSDGEGRAVAIEILQTYLSTNPRDLDATVRLAGYLSVVDSDELLVFLNQSPLTEEDTGLLLRRALVQRDQLRFEKALADFQAARELEPENSEVVRHLPAFERMELLLPELRSAEATLEERPEDFEALLTRAYCGQQIGLPKPQVYQDATAALEVVPSSAMARVLAAQGSPRSASEVRAQYSVPPGANLPNWEGFQKRLAVDMEIAGAPDNVELLVQRSYLLNEPPTYFELAVMDGRRALELDEALPDARVELLFAYGKLGRRTEAFEELQALRDLDPEPEVLARALNYLAEDELSSRRFAEGLSLATEAIDLHPTPRYLNTRANLYLRLGRSDEAAADRARADQLSNS